MENIITDIDLSKYNIMSFNDIISLIGDENI